MTEATCSIQDCGRAVLCRGWCGKHYQRWKKHGNPLAVKRARSHAAEAAFRARLTALGATLLEPEWLGANTAHRVLCPAGHECRPQPGSVQQGQGICRTCVGKDPAVAEAAFRSQVQALGGTVLGVYVNSTTRVQVRCQAGHICWPKPNHVQQGRGVCRECGIAAMREKVNLPRMADAERRFRALLDEMGVVLLDPYQGVLVRLRARCPVGHEFQVWPGKTVHCKTCGRKDQVAAKAKFRERLEELGVVLMEPGWLGSNQHHRVRCAAGHDYQVWPSVVMEGGGRCQRCTGRDPEVAEAKFRARVVELGGTPLYERWLGPHKGHHVRCANGHESWPSPGNVRRGGGLCRKCADLARTAPGGPVEAAFRDRLAELGATPLYEKWLGTKRKHHVRCANGHDCYPMPGNVLRSTGVCWTCAGNNPAAVEAAFRARLAELGATPLFGEWLGGHRPHYVRCAVGHDCWPHPSYVLQGEGVCRKCRGKLWDAFYVVEHEDRHRVKFGVTSGDARPRLADHRAAGYRTVVRLLTGLPDGAAHDAERAVKAALAMAGEKPVRGTEYFDASCLGLILDVADSWLARGADTEDCVIDSNGQLALFAA